MNTVDDRVAALLGGSAGARDDVAQLAVAIGQAGSAKRRKAIEDLANGRSEDDRRSLEPLIELISIVEGFGVQPVLEAIERSGQRRRRERAKR